MMDRGDDASTGRGGGGLFAPAIALGLLPLVDSDPRWLMAWPLAVPFYAIAAAHFLGYRFERGLLTALEARGLATWSFVAISIAALYGVGQLIVAALVPAAPVGHVLAAALATGFALVALLRLWPTPAVLMLWGELGHRRAWRSLPAAFGAAARLVRGRLVSHGFDLLATAMLVVLLAAPLLLYTRGLLMPELWRSGAIALYALVVAPAGWLLLLEATADRLARRARSKAPAAAVPAEEGALVLPDDGPQALPDDIAQPGLPGFSATPLSRLYAAARAGDVDRALAELELGADPFAAAPDGDSRSLPTLAASLEDLRLLRALLVRGLDPNADRGDGSPLAACLASPRPSVAALMMLIANGADPRQVDAQGRTALHRAAGHGDPGVAAILFDAGVAVDATDRDGHTALSLALAASNWRLARFLIERGAAIERRGAASALASAAAGDDDPAGVELLLNYRAKVDARDPLRRTALFQAALHGNARIATALLAAGADPDVADAQGATPLLEAARAGADGVIDVLLDHDLRRDACDRFGRTALMLAAASSRAGIGTIERLVAMGVPLEAVDSQGRNALALAPPDSDKAEHLHGVFAAAGLLPAVTETAEALAETLSEAADADVESREVPLEETLDPGSAPNVAAHGAPESDDPTLDPSANSAAPTEAGPTPGVSPAGSAVAAWLARMDQARATATAAAADQASSDPAEESSGEAFGAPEDAVEAPELNAPSATFEPAPLPDAAAAAETPLEPAVGDLGADNPPGESSPDSGRAVEPPSDPAPPLAFDAADGALAAARAGDYASLYDESVDAAALQKALTSGWAQVDVQPSPGALVTLAGRLSRLAPEQAAQRLSKALGDGRLDEAADLLDAGVSPAGAGLLARFLKARTAHVRNIAASEGFALELLGRGADPFGRSTPDGDPPLILAARASMGRLVSALLDAGVDPLSRGARDNALDVAIGQDDAPLLRKLLAAGAAQGLPGSDGRTALGRALALGADRTARLLKAGPWPRPRRRIMPTDLPAAAAVGDQHAVEWLVAMGIDVDAVDRQGATAVLRAAGGGHSGLVDYLLSIGADPDLPAASGATPLTAALSAGRLATLRALLAQGADADDRLPGGITALMVAAVLGRAEMAATLIGHGADVAARDERGNSALHAAAQKLFVTTTPAEAHDANATFVALIDAGSDSDVRNDAGVTPLVVLLGSRAEPGTATDEAAVLAAAERLFAHRVSLDARDSRGFEPLHLAALHGLMRVVRRLLAEGADPAARDSINRTPHDIALMRGFVDIARELAPGPTAAPSVARLLRPRS